MKADEAFSVLIGRIYDCALDSSLWPDERWLGLSEQRLASG